jgi:LysM repeat protein
MATPYAERTLLPTRGGPLRAAALLLAALLPVLSPRASAQEVDTTATSVYVVREGDTLYDLAARLDISVRLLATMNRPYPAILHAGDSLRVPTAKLSRDYSIRAGDTLMGLSRRFGVSVEAIRAANGLTDTMLRVGQKVVIPGQDVRGEAAPEAFFPDRTTVGTAVVYPRERIGRMLANGRSYDPSKFAVSHDRYRLGSIVLVRSRAAGRETFAEVVDRADALGPDLVDVSEAVADALGLDAPTGLEVEMLLIDERN